MKFFKSLLFSLCIPFIAFAQNPNPDPALDQEILLLMDIEKLPGTSTLIVSDGEIRWVESYGRKDFSTFDPVDDQTAFLMASISKTYTATALLQLWEEGAFQMDQPVNDFLPFEVKHPNNPDIPITFHMLLTHTSSIKDNWNVMEQYYTDGDPVVALGDFLESLLSESGSNYDPTKNFYPAPPATDYRYTNIGAALIGYLVEVISETPFDQYCNEHIFEPLCMDNTSWFLSGFDNLDNVAKPHYFQGGVYVPVEHFGFPDYPDGLLRSSIMDVANYLIALLEDGAFYDRQLLASATITEAMTEQIPDIESTQGLIWYQELLFHDNGSAWLWGHNGGELGTSTDIYLDPENEIAIAVLANGEGSNLEICDLLYNHALNLQADGVNPVDCENVSSTSEPIFYETTVFPNPSSGMLTIQLNEDASLPANIQIIDAFGRQVFQSNWKGHTQMELNLEHFSAGVYRFVLRDQSSQILSTSNFIIQP